MKKRPTRSTVARRIGEFEWIGRWQRRQRLPRDVRIGIGDDCAVIETGRRDVLGLLKCDACVERIHFAPRTPLQWVGQKVMARNVSDIAAMGGAPRFALVSVALPDRLGNPAIRSLHAGLERTARRFGCEIIGGDTSRSKSDLYVCVFLYGEVRPSRLLTRSGARAGDLVYVTGRLGGSIRGKHLRFEPRLKEAQWLAARFRPAAAIDLSDGLGGDLRRIAEQSRVGFEIFERQLPVSPGCLAADALYDGEDYELLFCVRPRIGPRLERAWRRNFRLKLTRIGIVKKAVHGIRLIDRAGASRPIQPSYDHFRRHPRA